MHSAYRTLGQVRFIGSGIAIKSRKFHSRRKFFEGVGGGEGGRVGLKIDLF